MELPSAGRTIYLNHAATSFPKPVEVAAAVASWLAHPPVDAGRSGGQEEDPRTPCRRVLAELLGVDEASRVILGPGATFAANLAVRGLLADGGAALCSRLEHNAVLRPLALLAKERGVRLEFVGPDSAGALDPRQVAAALRPETRLVALTHVSNVSGGRQPIEEVCALAAAAQVPVLVDASQSAGVLPFAYRSLPGRVFLVTSGHKALLGPPGIGVLVVPDAELPFWLVGGTGVLGESLEQPGDLPLRFEAGTPPWLSIVGLTAAVRTLLATGVRSAGDQRHALATDLAARLAELPGIDVVPVPQGDRRAGIVAFRVAGWEPHELADLLATAFGIQVRGGLHCAALAAAALGLPAGGSMRASVGWSSTRDDVLALVDALALLAGS